MYAEEKALDSYHNVLFSLVYFWRLFSTWPKRLVIVSHGFKRERVIERHCKTIGFTQSRVSFIGINPPEHLGIGKPATMKGNAMALEEWTADPHGERDPLATKRAKRNPWATDQALFKTKAEEAQSGVLLRVVPGVGQVLLSGVRQPWEDIGT